MTNPIQTPKLTLLNKTAIITGGASGLGLAIVKKFAAEGANIILFDLPTSKGKEVAEEVSKTHPLYHPDGNNYYYYHNHSPTGKTIDSNKATDTRKRVVFYGGSVTNQNDWNHVLTLTLNTFDNLDIVVNNAGVCYKSKPTDMVSPQEYEFVFGVNVKGMFLSTHVILPYFLEKKKKLDEARLNREDGEDNQSTTEREEGSYGGTFIQISSTAAIRPQPQLTWYNASKGAVSNATKSLAAEYGPYNIRFNSICPIACDTPLLPTLMGSSPVENKQKCVNAIPLQRLSKVQDIANAAAFLASDEAAFISGIDLEVDGARCV